MPRTPEDVKQESEREKVKCRGFKHAWDCDVDLNIVSERPTNGFFDPARCMRCYTIRLDELDWEGHIIRREYIYPDDYTMEIKAMSMPEARVWLYQRKPTDAQGGNRSNGQRTRRPQKASR